MGSLRFDVVPAEEGRPLQTLLTDLKPARQNIQAQAGDCVGRNAENKINFWYHSFFLFPFIRHFAYWPVLRLLSKLRQ
jgi:hypothetical protein